MRFLSFWVYLVYPYISWRIPIQYTPSFFPCLALDVKKYSIGKWQKLDFTLADKFDTTDERDRGPWSAGHTEIIEIKTRLLAAGF